MVHIIIMIPRLTNLFDGQASDQTTYNIIKFIYKHLPEYLSQVSITTFLSENTLIPNIDFEISMTPV